MQSDTLARGMTGTSSRPFPPRAQNDVASVLHVVPSVAPHHGGPSFAVRALASAQRALGMRVFVATTDDGQPRHGEGFDEDGVEYGYFRRDLPGVWKPSLALRRWLRTSASRFDVMHLHSLFCFSTAIGGRAAMHAGVPYVLSPHGALDPWSLRQSAWKKRTYLALAEGRTLDGAAALHVTTTAEATALKAFGVRAPLFVVPLGVPPETFEITRAPEHPSLRLVFLGRLHPKKGLDLLLRALAAARAEGADVELAIAGDGADHRRELETLVQELKLGAAVRFVGHVEGAAKARLLSDADAFVLTSFQENFGIAVAEAMAAGLPVIVSEEVGLASLVVEAAAGEVVPLDVAAIAAAIRRASADPAARRAAGDRARHAAKSFSWEQTAQRLREVYSEVIARGSRGGERP
ncbi:MAG TPA: glycosyltransferase [Gemmatimonadaceae bacterium]|nr:glycosyltransferase [Gemmatimonadaceae bacterium]